MFSIRDNRMVLLVQFTQGDASGLNDPSANAAVATSITADLCKSFICLTGVLFHWSASLRKLQTTSLKGFSPSIWLDHSPVQSLENSNEEIRFSSVDCPGSRIFICCSRSRKPDRSDAAISVAYGSRPQPREARSDRSISSTNFLRRAAVQLAHGEQAPAQGTFLSGLPYQRVRRQSCL